MSSKLSKTSPQPGQRLPVICPDGSAQAACLAELAAKHHGHTLVVLTAEANTAQRLLEEIPWFDSNLRVRLLPDWETLAYDHFSPHHDLVSERLAALWETWQGECDLLLAPVTTAIVRLPPPQYLASYSFNFQRGQHLDSEKLRAQVTLAGYNHVSQVLSPGEYAIRGGLVDLFPMGSILPYRIDLFDEQIESIKTFDVDTQRTLYPVDSLRLLPAREFPLDDAGRTTFRQRFREQFEGDPAKSTLYKDISNGIAPAGIEYYLPLFFEQLATIFDFLPPQTIIATQGDLAAPLNAFWQDARARYAMLDGDRTRPVLQPGDIFLSEEELFKALATRGRYLIQAGTNKDRQPPTNYFAPLPDLAVNRQANDPWLALRSFIDTFDGQILVAAESAGRRETLQHTLTEHGFVLKSVEDWRSCSERQKMVICVSPLHGGFLWQRENHKPLALVSESELYLDQPRRNRRDSKKTGADNWLRDLTELSPGDPVVHEVHGVGRYRGLTHMDLGEGTLEFLEIHYANDAKLFVPVAQLQVVGRYSGSDLEHAPLHKLGSGQWEKAKNKAAMQARDTAAELLQLYAVRAARQGHAFNINESDYERFCSSFPFVETPDQISAIEAVLGDLKNTRPMDRLVCGDVGFGKTEVALRAVFCAVVGGHQAAVLCPTTLLCEQHFQTFSDRFADWPIRVAELSRFKTAKEIKTVQEELAQGKLDIVIGTHRLLQKDVRFANLALIVIDEEHRFGVRQKEKLKALRSEVDVLTLTATPIPRTLAMSMEGLRDFSVISTAPQKRLSIKTFVSPLSDGLIREAVLRELKRGGQIYFVHNEISSIEYMRGKLEQLLPESRIVVGHGQMHERELERVMRDFSSQRANLLLCTTIIETGIDNPHANTILINRAEKFGLAQLHQLRGRVGRSHHQAYAYLMVYDQLAISKAARQRLEAIANTEELGAGFFLAMQDMEIRGAGQVLGDEQSGEMHEVGYSMYAEMLNRAVAAMKEGKMPDADEVAVGEGAGIEIELHTPALLPDTYCPDVHQRLVLYKRFANCTALSEISVLHEELVDRFGPLPEQAEGLLATHRLRVLLRPLHVDKIEASSERITMHFGTEFVRRQPIEPEKIINLIQHNKHYKLSGQDKLSFERHLPSLEAKIAATREMLSALTK